MPAPAKVFGTDQRAALGPLGRGGERGVHGAVGVVQCARAGDAAGRKNFGVATLVGATDTAITAAHVLIAPDGVRAGSCEFVLLRGGHSVDVVPVRNVRSPWEDRAAAGDPSRDIAVLKLARPIDPRLRIKLPAIGRPPREGAKVDLVAFHKDLPDFRLARRSRGRAYALPADSRFVPNYAATGVTVALPARVRAADYASIGGTSGGAVFAGRRLIGVHTGSFFTRRTEASAAFSTVDNFNHFTIVDAEIAALVAEVAGD